MNDALVQKEYIACYLLASDLNCIIFKWLVLDISFVISIIPLLQECYLNLKFVNLDLGDEIPGDGPAPPRRHGYAARENGAQQQRGAGRGKRGANKGRGAKSGMTLPDVPVMIGQDNFAGAQMMMQPGSSNVLIS